MPHKKWLLYAIALLVSSALFAQAWLGRASRPKPSTEPSLSAEAALFGTARTPALDAAAAAVPPPPVGMPGAPESPATLGAPAALSSAAQAGGADIDSWAQRAEQVSVASSSRSMEELALLLESRGGSFTGSDRRSEARSKPEEAVEREARGAGRLAGALSPWQEQERAALSLIAGEHPLQGILDLGGHKSAMLGGRTRREGEELGTSGAFVEEIRARSVVLKKGRSSLEVEFQLRRGPSGSASAAASPHDMPPMPPVPTGPAGATGPAGPTQLAPPSGAANDPSLDPSTRD